MIMGKRMLEFQLLISNVAEKMTLKQICIPFFCDHIKNKTREEDLKRGEIGEHASFESITSDVDQSSRGKN